MFNQVRRSEVDTESLAALARHEHRVDACDSMVRPRRSELCKYLKDLRGPLAGCETKTLSGRD
jgi:hypothetical protein